MRLVRAIAGWPSSSSTARTLQSSQGDGDFLEVGGIGVLLEGRENVERVDGISGGVMGVFLVGIDAASALLAKNDRDRKEKDQCTCGSNAGNGGGGQTTLGGRSFVGNCS